MPYETDDWDSLRDKIIGLGESSIQKSYYPELQKRLGELERFHALLDQSNDPIFLLEISSGRFTDVTKSASEQLGYPHEKMLEMTLKDIVNNDEMMRIQLILNEMVENKESTGKKTFSSVFNTVDSQKIPVEISASVVNFSDVLYIVMVVRDITEREKAEKAFEESEQRLTDIIDFLPDATFAIDQDGKVIAWNRAIEEMTGTKKEDFIGKGDYAYSVPWYNEHRPVLIDLIGNNDSEYISKYKYIKKDGKTIYAEVFVPSVYNGRGAYLWVTASPLLDSKGQQYGAIESVRDISDRKKAEDKIKKSLDEKETLLREIHHRVKNNMQIISSLLNLQIQYENLDETVGVLKESQGRVKSMAIIHEKLYQSSNLTYVNFKEYLEKLILDIFYSYGITTSAIESVLNIEDIHLNIDTAIPLGLIINELVTNSVKYAFPKCKGKINLKLVSNKDLIELTITDNGIGIPEDIDIENSKTLGLQLVKNLVNQLEGKLELDVNHGTEFKITFKELKYKERI